MLDRKRDYRKREKMILKYKSLSAFFVYRCLPFSLCLTLLGCAAGLEGPKSIEDTMVHEINEEPPISTEGSLWRENGDLGELFINPKARRVGDIVTVNIIESASASNNATTDTSRKSSLSGGMDSFLGYERQFSNPKHQFNPFGTIAGDLESEFAGSGSTQRSGKLTASITARVTDIFPNGNMKIFGSREIMVNNERQFITLSGIIRPPDISPDNIVLSTYISDAKIVYSGAGIINDRQGPGWLARILNRVWPL